MARHPLPEGVGRLSRPRIGSLPDLLERVLEGSAVAWPDRDHRGSRPGARSAFHSRTVSDSEAGFPIAGSVSAECAVIRREDYVAGTRDRPEVGIFTQWGGPREPLESV